MGRLGYHQQKSRRTGELSYIRRIGRLSYPRFHLYMQHKDKGLLLNLHLDEKQPSYQGQTAHSGQYGGELVTQELKRIRLSIGDWR